MKCTSSKKRPKVFLVNLTLGFFFWIPAVKHELYEKELSFLEEIPLPGMYPGSDLNTQGTEGWRTNLPKLITQFADEVGKLVHSNR